MFNLELRFPDQSAVVAHLERLRDGVDLGPASEEIATEMMRLNAEARRQGIDKDGVTLDEIQESTQERRDRAGRGGGPPLFPDEKARTATSFVAVPKRVSAFRWLIRCGWDDATYLRFHRTGASKGSWVLPRRDIVGPTPAMRQRGAELFHEHVQILVGARS